MKEVAKEIMTTLMGMVKEELEHPECADAKELGEVVDMIKDIAETTYYWNFAEEKEEQLKRLGKTTTTV